MLKAPPISRDLIEYLEKVFSPAHVRCSPDTNPHTLAGMVHRENGVQHVVQHLRAVHEEQQNEDPLNVSQDSQAP